MVGDEACRLIRKRTGRAGHLLLSAEAAERLETMARRPSVVDRQVVSACAASLAAQRRLEDSIGAAPLVKATTSQATLIATLVRQARGPGRADLADVAGQWAQFTAWLHADTGLFREALAWYERCGQLADEAGNPSLAATALSMKGHLAWMTGDTQAMIGLSHAAAAVSGASPGMVAMARQQAARGHAIAGEADRVDPLLDQARVLAERAAREPDGEPAWSYFYDPHVLEMQRGLAHLLAGKPDAADLLTCGLVALGADADASWSVWYRLHQAEACQLIGEPEAAADAVRHAAATARRLGSVRLDAALRRLRRDLIRHWPDVPVITSLAQVDA